MKTGWVERWEEGRIGWHEAAGNRGLKRHWRARDRDVLVPLCGKAQDLIWLAEQGNRVTGVELAPLAVQQFFAESGLSHDIDESGALPVYAARELPVRIACGDYFEFAETGFDAHFDRGALVALPAELRGRYAAHTQGLLGEAALQCVITVEYDQKVAAGPPFAVPQAELTAYWPRLELKEARDDSADMPPKFREAGLRVFSECVWMTPDSGG
ncbi:MAG: thiopurine S-methyltransferase [Pseudomonadota bacterium]